MSQLKSYGFMVLGLMSTTIYAQPMQFDRVGSGFGTQSLSTGQWAWEQSIADAAWLRSQLNGDVAKTTTVQAKTLVRAGVGQAWEVQLGWDGPSWMRDSQQGFSDEESGFGDVTVGLKKTIDLQDDKLSMAIRAQATLDSGDDAFSVQEPIYTFSSSLQYLFEENIQTGVSMHYAIQDGDWSLTAVPRLHYQFSPKLTAFSELVYRKMESQDAQYGLGLGTLYQLNERVQLNAGLGMELGTLDDHYQSRLGFAVLF